MQTIATGLSPLPRRLFAVVAFKANWLLLVVGQARWLEWAALVLAVQLLLCLAPGRGLALRRLAMLHVFACLGILLDGLLSSADLLRFAGGVLPPWLCLLWAAFACLLLQMHELLQRARTPVLALVGAAAGGTGYGAGAWLDAVNLGGAPALTMVLITLLWSGVLPLARVLFAFPGEES